MGRFSESAPHDHPKIPWKGWQDRSQRPKDLNARLR